MFNSIYPEVPTILKIWKDQAKIPIYVGVGSADFLIMVLTNTNHGNILPLFNGHMNIMDFDGTKANKDFKKLISILRLPPEKILYLTRFRQDCRRASESGLQSLIVLRPDFDTHGSIKQLMLKRGAATGLDATKAKKITHEDASSPPIKGRQIPDNKDLRDEYGRQISSLSLIDDHDDNDRYNTQSSQIVEQDLTRYNIVLSLSEIAFK